MTADEYRELLYHPPSRHDDECDGCHNEATQLWELPEEGEFLWCSMCIRRAAARIERREQQQSHKRR